MIRMNKVNELIEKTYFIAGDIVEIRHNIENKPKMFITEKVTKTVKDKNGNIETIFIGLRCKWFDKQQVLHEAIFSTKDLKHIE